METAAFAHPVVLPSTMTVHHSNHHQHHHPHQHHHSKRMHVIGKPAAAAAASAGQSTSASMMTTNADQQHSRLVTLLKTTFSSTFDENCPTAAHLQTDDSAAQEAVFQDSPPTSPLDLGREGDSPPPPSPPSSYGARELLDNKIVQVVDSVKSHLLNAVRVEVEMLKAKILNLEEKVANLEFENKILRQYAPMDVLTQLQNLDDDEDQEHLSSLRQCVF